ncbi:hypothetical protein ACJJTC_008983 [Scirpophaga incertulas]
MGGCSILGFKSRSERKISGITFHNFPSDPEVKAPIEYCTDVLQEVQVNTPPTSNIPSLDITSSKKRICEFGDFLSAEPSTSRSCENIFKRKGLLKYLRMFHQLFQNSNFHHTPTTIREQNRQLGDILLAGPSSSTGSENIPLNRTIAEHQTVVLNAPVLESTPITTLIKKKLAKQKEISASRLKKLRAVRISRRRLVKKVSALEDIIAELKCKMLINTEQSETLCSINVTNENKDFLKRFLQ